MSGVTRVTLHCAPFTSWEMPFPPDLNGVLGVQVLEVSAQHVCAAKFPRAPGERALYGHLAVCLVHHVSGTCTFFQQVIRNNHLLVDVVRAREVRSKTSGLEFFLTRMAFDYP